MNISYKAVLIIGLLEFHQKFFKESESLARFFIDGKAWNILFYLGKRVIEENQGA